MADHPDIPALVAELMAAESHSRCVWRGRDTRCGLCAGCVNADLLKRSRRALSNLTRALAERDALLAAREAQKPPAVAPTTTAYPPIVPRANGCISVWTPHRPGLSGVCDRCGQRVNQ